MLIIAGWLRTEPADRDAYVADCAAVVEAARGAPGCLDFVLTADPIEPERVHIYERWDNETDLLAFRGSGPDAGSAARIRGAEVRRYLISGVEDP